MSLKEKIQEDMKSAMRARDQRRLGVIRLLLAAIKQREVDERIVLDDLQVLSVISQMLKQRRDSISHYEQAKRQDLVDQEAFEITVLQPYLPPPLTDEEVDNLIQAALRETGATSAKDIGKVMAILRPKIQGKTDIAVVSAKIKAALD